MGIDPARGADKVLRIHARAQNGQMRNFVYNEGQTVNARMFTGGGFPGGGYPGGGYPGTNPGRNLRIVQATYGAGNRRRDVTSRLQSLVRNNRLSVLVNNTTMGGDPAVGQTKDVMVTYDYQGESQPHHTRGQPPEPTLAESIAPSL